MDGQVPYNDGEIGFSLEKAATRIGRALIRRQAGSMGTAAPILYSDEPGQFTDGDGTHLSGAKLYDNFVKAHANHDPAQTPPAQLLTTHLGAIVKSYENIERLIVIGGGSYETFMAQEGQLLEGIHKANPEKTSMEVILNDVSDSYMDEDEKALHDLGKRLGIEYKVLKLKADFTQVSGEKFDSILETSGLAKRADIAAGLISTGATFGNVEGVSDLESMPSGLIDKRMAQMGELVGPGSVVGFDCFNTLDDSAGYYNTPELEHFFLNGMDMIRRHCEGLDGLHVTLPSTGNMFRYAPKAFLKSRLLAHRLEVVEQQRVTITNGTGPVSHDIGDSYHMMYSLRPRQDQINDRPKSNTGLKPITSMTQSDLTFYMFNKTAKKPAILNGDDMPENLTTSSPPYAHNTVARTGLVAAARARVQNLVVRTVGRQFNVA